jgi:peptidoglycan-associated lipoprotein
LGEVKNSPGKMKRAKFLNLLIASTMLALLATGCKKNPKNITPIGANQRTIGDGQLGRPLGGNRDTGLPVSQSGTQGQAIDPGAIADPMANANEDAAALAQQSVYFAYDRSAINPSEQPKLEQVATYVKNTPGVQLKILGHCDERGTEEYNRSLGERRAISAREFLIQKHGIESSRITTTSFGEDKPVSLEKTEEGYAKNRRAEFVILRPQ